MFNINKKTFNIVKFIEWFIPIYYWCMENTTHLACRLSIYVPSFQIHRQFSCILEKVHSGKISHIPLLLNSFSPDAHILLGFALTLLYFFYEVTSFYLHMLKNSVTKVQVKWLAKGVVELYMHTYMDALLVMDSLLCFRIHYEFMEWYRGLLFLINLRVEPSCNNFISAFLCNAEWIRCAQ